MVMALTLWAQPTVSPTFTHILWQAHMMVLTDTHHILVGPFDGLGRILTGPN